ncbi:hypothetical protein BHS07_00970 [Myxococcus xanthus]|nr:hypothetical protein BHS07_00970 [Myxococcus xanthus]
MPHELELRDASRRGSQDARAVLLHVTRVAVAMVAMGMAVLAAVERGLLGDDAGTVLLGVTLVAVAVVTMQMSVATTFLDGLLGDDAGKAVRDKAVVAVAMVAMEVPIPSTLDFVGVGIRSAAGGEENRHRGQEGQSKRSRMHHGSRHMGEMARSVQAASARLAVSHVQCCFATVLQ